MSIFLLGAVDTHNVPVCDVLALFGGNLALASKENGFGCGNEALDFHSKGFHPDVLVFGMLHEVAVFQEFASLVVKDSGSHVMKELERVLSGSCFLGGKWRLLACLFEYLKDGVLSDHALVMVL